MSRKFHDEDGYDNEAELDEDELYLRETSGYLDEEDDEQAIWDGDEFVGEEETEDFQIEDDEY